MKKVTIMEKFIVGLLIGIIAGMVLIALAIRGITNQRAIELNYAGYNVKTGDFEWYNKDAKYLVTGEKDK
jgi:uncharacterized membrane-anchored protein YhcB (DUF1043 family)